MSGGDGDGVTAGSSWNEPISLVDDDNDHTSTAATTTNSSTDAAAKVFCNPLGNRYRSIRDIIHRTIDIEEEPQVVAGESQATASLDDNDIAPMRAGAMKKELESYGISTAALIEKSELVWAPTKALAKARADGLKPIEPQAVSGPLPPRNADGCMLHPKHPIKIFATHRDKGLRRKLRRLRRQRQIKGSSNCQQPQEEHWSTFHCWTFREILGFDRFSALRMEGQQKEQPQNTSSGSNSNSHEERYKLALEEGRSMNISSLKQNLQDKGVSTTSFLEKSSLVEAYAKTTVDGSTKGQHSASAVGIDWIFITSYILDMDFLLKEIPELLDVPNVVVIYHYEQDSSVEGASQQRQLEWVQEASRRGHSLLLMVRSPRATPKTDENPLSTVMEYGCHHTKMVLIGYSSQRLRVVVHTSNIMKYGMHDMCQGAFVQDFLPKTPDQLDNFETSGFEESLVTYLESYNLGTPLVWNSKEQKQPLVAHLQSYDFSTAVGVLIPSIPGYHKTESYIDKSKLFGYLKVQQAIRDHCLKNHSKCDSNNAENCQNTNIVCQFSSMGSLSKNYLNKISDAWNVHKVKSNSSSNNTLVRNPYRSNKKARLEGNTNQKEEPMSLLSIIWPTVDEVRNGVEFLHVGGAVPGRSKNLNKDFLRPLLHKWGKSKEPHNENNRENDLQLDKARHVPHIKSYYQVSNNANNTTTTTLSQEENDNHNMDWFVLSSHNLSKAAWGEIQNRRVPWGMGETEETLVVQHWELGVFVSPSTLGVDTMGPLSSPSISRKDDDDDKRTVIPLPYKIHPDKYNDSDRPWVVE